MPPDSPPPLELPGSPRLMLEFEDRYDSFPDDLPVIFRAPRPADVADVLASLDAIYAVMVLDFSPPAPEDGELEWIARHQHFSRKMSLRAARFESPLQFLLELPPVVYATTGFSGFAYGVAHVFGVPYQAAARFHRARTEYFESRVEAADAKDAWLDRKAERGKKSPFTLRRVDERDSLPPATSDSD